MGIKCTMLSECNMMTEEKKMLTVWICTGRKSIKRWECGAPYNIHIMHCYEVLVDCKHLTKRNGEGWSELDEQQILRKQKQFEEPAARWNMRLMKDVHDWMYVWIAGMDPWCFVEGKTVKETALG